MSQPELDRAKAELLLEPGLYKDSLFVSDACLLAMLRTVEGRRLLVVGPADNASCGAFEGDSAGAGRHAWRSCPLTHTNAVLLRRLLPWSAPQPVARHKTTMGFGDRLGRATPGHLRAIRRFDVAPVLAQQSVRELSLTGRTFESVIDDVSFLVFQCGYTAGFGADGDHLKTLDQVSAALDAGVTMITLDLSGVVRADLAELPPAEIAAEFAGLPRSLQAAMLARYAGQSFPLRRAGHIPETVTISPAEARRCTVLYSAALDFAVEVHKLLVARRGSGQCDFEISLDETTTPTVPAHHLFFARELQRRRVSVTSLAPRFAGAFEKGIDYVGDVSEFTRQLRTHFLIARASGDYKLSIHSGSDKFAIFPIVGKLTDCRFHLKTAGTSWLEAVRLAARRAPDLFRQIQRVAIERLPEALKLYHISADPARIPPLESLADADLPALLEQDAARQVLHVAYGFVLESSDMRARLFELLDRCEDEYESLLESHFAHHLETLGVPPRKGMRGP